MRILISTVFHPSTGGIETVTSILAHEWTRLSYEVRVAASTPASADDQKKFPFEVIHCPKALHLLKLVEWCEVYVQGAVSLKTLWPLALKKRRYVVTHQTSYRRDDGSHNWQGRLKQVASSRAINIACSEATARDLGLPCAVVHNPYDDKCFFEQPCAERKRELAFVGRLVSDKGADLLLEALALLQQEGQNPRLTIIGDGPERAVLEEQVRSLGLEEQVAFVGRQEPASVARLLNGHQVLVVPSLWQEPFGIVALEGIACGCLVVGSQGGGLQEAIGPCGLTFPNGDARALAGQIRLALDDQVLGASLRAQAPAHLERHRPEHVARRYIEIIGQGSAQKGVQQSR